MQSERFIEEVLTLFQQNLTGVHFQKAHDYAEYSSVKQIGITMEEAGADAQLSGEEHLLVCHIFLPAEKGLVCAEKLVRDMCALLQDNGMEIARLTKSAVQTDEELGLMVIPCAVTVRRLSCVKITLNGRAFRARAVRESVSYTSQEITAAGETEPFAVRQRPRYTVTLNGFDAEALGNLRQFTVRIGGDSPAVYLRCEWTRYAPEKQEFVFVSPERRDGA